MKRIVALLILCAIPATSLALTQAQQVVVAGQALAGADTLGGAKITITLVGGTCWSGTDILPSFTTVTYASAAGLWSKALVGTDSITCAGGVTPTYTIQITHPVLDLAGMSIKYEGLRIPANNGATTQLRTIVNQQ